MKSNSRRKNKATPSVKAHNVKKKVQVAEAAAAKAREGSFAYKHPAAVELGKIWDGFDVPIESVDVFLFWEKRDGVWVEVPDGDLIYKVDAETKGYWGRRRNKKTGEWKPEWRNVEVSKEAVKKAREKAEKTGKPVELPEPSSCEKFEVQFSPHHLAYANRVMAKIREAELAKGASDKEANKAADLWAIDVIARAVPKLGDYLEWRTGRRVFLMPLHTISGKWHLTPWTTYVGLDGRIQGLIQGGRGGRTIVGYESQLDAGYELPDYRLEIYKRKLAIEKSRAKRYPDKRYVDVGLSKILLEHVRAEMEARGEQDLWEEACAEYRAALVKAEPLKLEMEAFKAARLAEYLEKVKGAEVREREVRIEEKALSVKERLNEVLEDEEMRQLTKVYSLPRIGALVLDGVVKVAQLAVWAAESLERLLRELARLFNGGNGNMEGAGSFSGAGDQAAEKPVLEVVEASPEPVVVVENPEPLRSWRKALADAGREPGPEFAAVIANVEGDREWADGLTGEMWIAAQTEMVSLGLVAEEALATARAVLTPEREKTQDDEPEPPLSLDWDESRDPTGDRLWSFQRDMDRHPQLSLLEEAHKVELAKLLVMEKVSWDKVEVTSLHFKASDVLEVVRAGLRTKERPQPEVGGPK